MIHRIEMKKENFTAVSTSVFEKTEEDTVLRIAKNTDGHAANTYAKINNLSFHNGTIHVKVLSRLLEDAPPIARGFIGIAFRINDDDSEFESLYVRPVNGRTDDPVRRNIAVQYFSWPTYTFAYFRERGITDYGAG